MRVTLVHQDLKAQIRQYQVVRQYTVEIENRAKSRLAVFATQSENTDAEPVQRRQDRPKIRKTTVTKETSSIQL